MDIKKVRLGKTGLWVTKTAMGCLPIQRISKEAAKTLLRKAYDNGINYFDTANMYTDSEEKSEQRCMMSARTLSFPQKRRHGLQNGNRAYRTFLKTAADRLHRPLPVP